MKMKNTFVIAALIAGSVLAANTAVYAQQSTNPPAAGAHPGGPGARPRLAFDNIAKQLALSDDQKTKAKPIFEELNQKNSEARQLSGAERQAKTKENIAAATAKLQDILTPEQMTQWKKISTPGHRPAGAAGAPPAATPPPQP